MAITIYSGIARRLKQRRSVYLAGPMHTTRASTIRANNTRDATAQRDPHRRTNAEGLVQNDRFGVRHDKLEFRTSQQRPVQVFTPGRSPMGAASHAGIRAGVSIDG